MLTKLKSLFQSAPQRLDEQAFTLHVSTAIQAAHPDVSVSTGAPLELVIKSADQEAFTESLKDIYDNYRLEPGKLEALKTLKVSAIGDRLMLSAINVGRENLVPLVRIEDPRASPLIIQRPLTNGLVSVLAFNHPTGVEDTTQSDLGVLQLTEDHAFAVALENLEQRAGELQIEHLDHGLWVITGTTLPASSMLLAADFWNQGSFAESRTLAAYAPDRNQLVIVDVDFEEAVQSGATLADELYAESKDQLSVEAIIIKDGEAPAVEPAPVVEEPAMPEPVEPVPAMAESYAAVAPEEVNTEENNVGENVDRIVAIVMPANEAHRGGWLSRPLTGNLVSALALELSNEVKALSLTDVDRLGVRLEEIFDLAIENISLRFNDLEVKEIEAGVHLVVCHNMAPGAALFCRPLWFDGPFAAYRDLGAYLLPAHGLLVFDPTDRMVEPVVQEVLEHFADTLQPGRKAAFVNVKHSGSLIDLTGQQAQAPIPAYNMSARRFGRAAR